ncbi:MAG: hypothetical protein JWN86_2684 [Planctomycetota bacterium]|nr:hypothetical protein [Planctomycetota bacterium]
MRSLAISSALALALIAPLSARAEHAKVTLEVEAGSKKETAFVDQTPPDTGKNPRPVLKVKAGETIKIQWTLTNVYPNKTLADVLVHSFVVKQAKVGQKELPPIVDDVELETAYRMDFKPGGKSGARCKLKIDTPGVYLIRVETRDTQSDHEHFAAIDLVVEGAEKK